MKIPRAIRPVSAALLFALVLGASARAEVPPGVLDEEPAGDAAPAIADPLEGLNRVFFRFNDGVHRVVVRPVSKGYRAAVPAPVRRGLGNFFSNLLYPVRLAGNLLQGRGHGAWVETQRFGVNSIAGLGGFLATADRVPSLRLEDHEDLGQAFARWGLGHGAYLVLPLLGPTSVRDGIGDGLSSLYLAPEQYLHEWEQTAIYRGTDALNHSPGTVRNYETITGGAIDPYIALRDAFAAHRAHQQKL